MMQLKNMKDLVNNIWKKVNLKNTNNEVCWILHIENNIIYIVHNNNKVDWWNPDIMPNWFKYSRFIWEDCEEELYDDIFLVWDNFKFIS